MGLIQFHLRRQVSPHLHRDSPAHLLRRLKCQPPLEVRVVLIQHDTGADLRPTPADLSAGGALRVFGPLAAHQVPEPLQYRHLNTSFTSPGLCIAALPPRTHRPR